MKLPNSDKAYVPPPKLQDYLLSSTHSVGKWKARFFRSLGYDKANAGDLEQRLLAIARIEEVKEVVPFDHGAKYVVEGSLRAPAGGLVKVRTVWIIEREGESPRLVTMYPV